MALYWTEWRERGYGLGTYGIDSELPMLLIDR
jgi:hypothetical protein